MKHYGNIVVEMDERSRAKITMVVDVCKQLPLVPIDGNIVMLPNKKLYIHAGQWNLIPFGDTQYINALKAHSNCQYITHDGEMNVDCGGLYIFNNPEINSIILPPSSLMCGVEFKFKNLTEVQCVIRSMEFECIDCESKLILNPRSSCTLTSLQHEWIVLNKYCA
jgi:hypothetical protein